MAALAVCAAAAGCDSGGGRPVPSASPTSVAAAACAPVVASGERLVAAYDTTVGAVRDTTAGPGGKPAAAFAPRRAATDAAAWCWIDSVAGDERRVVARTTAGDEQVFVRGGARGMSPGPDGPQVP